MELTVLIENNTIIDQYYFAEPAVSYLLQDSNTALLFDVGYSGLFLENAKLMDIDLNSIDTIVLSHGHIDHTGGLPYFFETYKNKVDIYAHPLTFLPKVYEEEQIGSPMSEDELKQNANLVLTNHPIQINEHLVFLGEIPKRVPFEDRIPIGNIVNNNKEQTDRLYDDTAIVYKNKNGLFIITGCSHSGICNIIEYAKEVCEDERIAGVIGGFHLPKLDKRAKDTIDYLKKQKIKMLYPSHCTDFTVRAAMHNEMPTQEVGVGMTIDLNE